MARVFLFASSILCRTTAIPASCTCYSKNNSSRSESSSTRCNYPSSSFTDCRKHLSYFASCGHPYGVEVVGDPYDVFAPGSVRHPLRPFFRWWFPRQLRHQCYHACAAAYVTESSLQRRYPPNPEAFVTHYSDVELPAEAFVSSPRTQFNLRPLTIIFVGTLQQLYKAPDVLINAVGKCIKEGLDLRLVIVGDGQYRAKFQAQAVNLGIGDKVIFTGQLSKGAAVRGAVGSSRSFCPSFSHGRTATRDD